MHSSVGRRTWLFNGNRHSSPFECAQIPPAASVRTAMCIPIVSTVESVAALPMSSPKRKLSDADAPSSRTFALIETDAHELDQIIDVLRQFFPNTKILDYHHAPAIPPPTSTATTCASQFLISSIDTEQASANASSQIFKGKVKNYLQRRYLEQTGEERADSEAFTKHRGHKMSSHEASATAFKSHSFDLSHGSAKSESSSLVRTPSKRGHLRHYTTIDLDDTSNDAGKITFSIDEPEDDDDADDDNDDEDVDDADDDEDENDEGRVDIGKSSSKHYSSTEPKSNQKSSRFLLPYHPSSEQEPGVRSSPFPGGIQLPLTPYSVSSDPGPFRSPWFNTPTSPFNFRFPQSHELAHVNAQGTIAQLSSLTKMLCDEPSVFTPISPRIKTEKQQSNPSGDSSSSVPPCQICRQEFTSHHSYLIHYRTHLEPSSEHDPSDMLHCDRLGDLRNYSCKICSKRFSRSDMLNRHLRSHSGIRPYRCTMCNTFFSRSDHLSTHLRTHTGEKPYTCPQCSYTACRRDMITRHLKIHMKQRSERKNATSTFASSNEL